MEAKHRFRKLFVRLVFLALLGWLVALVRAVRPKRGWDEWGDTQEEWKPKPVPEDDESDEPQAARRPFRKHRLATSFALVGVFFAAATFTAGAGDMIAKAMEPDQCAAYMQSIGEDPSECEQMAQDAASALPPESAPVEEPAAAPEPESELAPDLTPVVEEPSAAEAVAGFEAETSSDPAAAAEAPAASEAAPASDAAPAAPTVDDPESYVLAPEPVAPAARKQKKTRHWVVRRAQPEAAAPVVEEEGGAATVWLNRALPDATPPAKRLSPAFAANLTRISAKYGVNWALVLGVLRAEGARDRVPATARELRTLARGLGQRGAMDNEWNAVLALSGRTGFADRAIALARYNRTVGLQALVKGLESAKPRLIERLLSDERATIYAGGREDLRLGRVDVRVVVLISYLAESYGEVTVSSLFSGHRKYARPGVISAHVYGHAADIATVGGIPIAGHQEPGSITEKAVRSILMLPVEIQPRQVISLLGMGGPSFPMANHHDHIHVGF